MKISEKVCFFLGGGGYFLTHTEDVSVFVEHSAVTGHPITMCVTVCFSSRSDYAYARYNNRSHGDSVAAAACYTRCVLATTAIDDDDSKRFANNSLSSPINTSDAGYVSPRCRCVCRMVEWSVC